MNATEKILISGIAGTVFMTLFLRSKSSYKQEFMPPVLLNKSIDNAPDFPDIKNKKANPTGWILHYLTGIGFMAAYRFLGKKFLNHPTIEKIGISAVINGSMGVFIWGKLFQIHPSPPQNNRSSYFKYLFTAHIIFTITSLLTYETLNRNLKP